MRFSIKGLALASGIVVHRYVCEPDLACEYLCLCELPAPIFRNIMRGRKCEHGASSALWWSVTPCSARSLPSFSENWHSALSEYVLQSASQPKPLLPASAQRCGMFPSLQAMVAVFKAGLRVQQKRTAMP